MIPLAAGAFYSVLGLMLRPELSATAMILSDVSVVRLPPDEEARG